MFTENNVRSDSHLSDQEKKSTQSAIENQSAVAKPHKRVVDPVDMLKNLRLRKVLLSSIKQTSASLDNGVTLNHSISINV